MTFEAKFGGMTKAADRVRGRLVAGAIGAGLLAFGGAYAQPLQLAPSAQNTSSVVVAPEAQKGVRQEELEKVLAEQKRNADLTARLKAELDAIGEDRRKLNAMLIGSAANIRDLEDRIRPPPRRGSAALQTSEDTVRRSLASRRAVIAEVLAALQRVGRKPPPALLVSPEDALQSVRTAILLGAVLPDMKIEVDTLLADLAELVRVRSEIAAERDALGRDLAALSQERTRMTVLVAGAPAQASGYRESARIRARPVGAAGPAGGQPQRFDRPNRAGNRQCRPRGRRGPGGPRSPIRSQALRRSTIPAACRRRLPLRQPGKRCRCRSTASRFANSACRTASAEPKRAYLSQAGPARR